MNQHPVMVFIEQTANIIAPVSLELISEATKLAAKLQTKVIGCALGHNLKNELNVLAHYGCEQIIYTDDARLAHFTSVPYAKTIVKIIQKYQPQVVLFGATTIGRDVAPRVASELKCGLTADCTSLEIGDYKSKDKTWTNALLQIRPAFGGNIVATIVSPESFPSMATVREGVMKLNTPDTKKHAEIINEPCALSTNDFLTEIIEVVKKEKAVDLKGARIIVGAGMGAATAQGMKNVRELAKVLGAEIAASRPVVDGGHFVKDHQVGQTGLTVRPNLYIACGISGQIQHCAGMSESMRIIAINNDPKAPIFGVAHYGIVGDLNEVLPRMIKAYKAKV